MLHLRAAFGCRVGYLPFQLLLMDLTSLTSFCRALGAGQDLKEFDCDHRLGLAALKRIFTDILGNSSAMPEVKVCSIPFWFVANRCAVLSLDDGTCNLRNRNGKLEALLKGAKVHEMHHLGACAGTRGASSGTDGAERGLQQPKHVL